MLCISISKSCVVLSGLTYAAGAPLYTLDAAIGFGAFLAMGPGRIFSIMMPLSVSMGPAWLLPELGYEGLPVDASISTAWPTYCSS
jgi:hypothetical protein